MSDVTSSSSWWVCDWTPGPRPSTPVLLEPVDIQCPVPASTAANNLDFHILITQICWNQMPSSPPSPEKTLQQALSPNARVEQFMAEARLRAGLAGEEMQAGAAYVSHVVAQPSCGAEDVCVNPLAAEEQGVREAIKVRHAELVLNNLLNKLHEAVDEVEALLYDLDGKPMCAVTCDVFSMVAEMAYIQIATAHHRQRYDLLKWLLRGDTQPYDFDISRQFTVLHSAYMHLGELQGMWHCS